MCQRYIELSVELSSNLKVWIVLEYLPAIHFDYLTTVSQRQKLP